MLRTFQLFTAIILFSVSGAAYDFGYPGRDGQDGRDGRDGSNGENKVVFATGQAVNLDAAGNLGEPASDGYDGENASSCYQPKPEYNVRGAKGGDGGRGGDGGSGGDGGNLMLYAADAANAKMIKIDSRPGRGGRGGYGARGGYGCRCQQYSWSIKKCVTEKDKDGKPVTVCNNYTYYCEGGRTGEDGRQGYYGSNGKTGTMYFVNSLTELQPEVTKANIYIGDILKTAVKLSDNIWTARSGAASMLGAGSYIADNFQ
ncbi:MAG: collagen-like protein, partial [Bdellovibrionia bacterium]